MKEEASKKEAWPNMNRAYVDVICDQIKIHNNGRSTIDCSHSAANHVTSQRRFKATLGKIISQIRKTGLLCARLCNLTQVFVHVLSLIY